MLDHARNRVQSRAQSIRIRDLAQVQIKDIVALIGQVGVIHITAQNDIFFDKRPIDTRAVRANVEKALAENPGAAVIIVADRMSNTSALIEVMDQARLAGAASVSVATEE